MGFSARWCLYFLPAVLSSFAFMTSVLFGFWCESVKFVAKNSAQDPDLYYGPWYLQQERVSSTQIGDKTIVSTGSVCVHYPTGGGSAVVVDSNWKASRAFTILAAVTGGLMTVGLWFAPCVTNFRTVDSGSWTGTAGCFSIIITLFQGLTFLLLRGNVCSFQDNPAAVAAASGAAYHETCELAPGSTANIISIVLWCLTGVSMIALGPPTAPDRPPPETQAVTYERTANPDGTGTTVTEVKVVKGTAVVPPPPTLEETAKEQP